MTRTFPEIAAALADALPGRQVGLDGEIVAMDPATGAPEFGQLQQRLGTTATPALQAQTPVSYIVFDLTHLDGHPTIDLPYTQRRAMLADLGINHPSLPVPPHQLDVAPASLLELAKAHHIEGIVGKRLDSPYRPGRSPAWLKHPLRQRIEVVVGGWTHGQGNRTKILGALLLGLPGPDTTPTGQGLVFIGAVGTGWTMATAGHLFRQLADLASDTSPFTEPLPRLYARNARWVRPALIGDVEYRSRTNEGYLRHPSWKGLRLDKTLTDLRP
jgi:bifunctional non-homologous end joining protein LigD